ncbi:NADH dehydrogenase [ubiquinone] 1 beta subcomplex subunit 8, mitochondrial [Parasteatoda tepidariorum]|uniref:NADH dehydrogenase [ubiquinone] 1 beta subcomplex subunit 8, mitochondrial n=1 Tax=Parasteatoda tepidariorum TaxID=114398 RepID=UPI001C726996|nr:NADH dehydrogenase [ubiquinone] 1 beta subcomplex subunit 8, mitochondrial [Parasteatoda tepidariorum]
MLRTSQFAKILYKNRDLKKFLANYGNITRSMSSVTTWNKDWKPGPYPRTKEEKIAAAKKYYMLPEDYEPYPEEEGFGDYPKFKMVHMENRNPHEPYDWESLKRNYCEPMHPDFDLCVEDKINFDKKFKTPLWRQFIYLATGVTLWMTIGYWDITHPLDQHIVNKQYPHSGQVHYSFEPAEE